MRGVEHTTANQSLWFRQEQDMKRVGKVKVVCGEAGSCGDQFLQSFASRFTGQLHQDVGRDDRVRCFADDGGVAKAFKSLKTMQKVFPNASSHGAERKFSRSGITAKDVQISGAVRRS